MSMNFAAATISGFARRVGDLRAAGNSQVINIAIPVDRFRKGSDGESITDWWDVEVWGKGAEILAQYLRKGDIVTATGRPEMESYQATDGATKFKLVLRSAQVQFQSMQPKAQDDYPF